MLSFKNQVVIITGAGKGLGKAHALEFAKRGAKVIVNNRRHPQEGEYSSADETVKDILALGGTAVANYQDISQPKAGENLLCCATEHFGKLDSLVLNAGITSRAAFHKSTLDEFKHIMDVNLFANVALLQPLLAYFRKQTYGRILFTISSAGLYGQPGASAYSASKGALQAFMLSLAQENAHHGIYCNALAPFAVSQMTEEYLSAAQKDLLSPDKASPMALWLSHPDCDANGQTWVAAGGLFRKVHCMENTNKQLGCFTSPEQIQQHWKKLTQGDTDYQSFAHAELAFIDLLNQLN